MSAKSDSPADPFHVFSDEVLEETPPRLTKFLLGLGALPDVLSLLAPHGLTDEAIVEGRELLLDTLAQPMLRTAAANTLDVPAARQAGAEINQTDEPLYAKGRAVLVRYHPDAARYVFDGLAASTTASESVQGMGTFLARVEALETGSDPARRDRREADLDAVRRLAERGITKEERARLAALVAKALGPAEARLDHGDLLETRRARLIAARLWYDDWVATTKAHVKKRQHLIRLGLASPRKPKSASAPSAPTSDDD